MINTKNANSIIKNKLKEKGLDYIYKYIGDNSLISFDEKDLELILLYFDIINYYNGNIYLNNEINFNFIRNDDSQGLIIVEANDYLTLKSLEKILSSIRKSIGDNVNLIYSVYYNKNIPNNIVYLTVINTGDLEKNNTSRIDTVDSIGNTIEEIAKICKEKDNYSINFIQQIANCGFNKALKIKQEILHNTPYLNDEENKTNKSSQYENNEAKQYNIEEIARICKENNNYSVSFIQQIANCGFNKALKIKEEIQDE